MHLALKTSAGQRVVRKVLEGQEVAAPDGFQITSSAKKVCLLLAP
jgi:hypothetical protein